MKKILIVLSAITIIACKNSENSEKKPAEEQTNQELAQNESEEYLKRGEEFSTENVLSAEEMKAEFDAMKPGDTISVKFKSEVEKVCKKKGCWMTLKLDDSLTSFVKFKDYAFFVPLNAENSETIVKGKAYITETPVEELRHFAKDAGKSEAEIAAITTPKREYAFMANGVLMKNKNE
ncbi:DUF4920 domain-containing protein [Mesonia maritima]|uniref:DUF4920 domain-containing protein n=1 Tax=Mesonia maritima TaxID=1793873 RepID=A0ABU1K4K9_9FLAO|nr:DUF4920 domain-containing protein [Mesonia maritima]MDR6300528.1 hypothetical protein [Mesonia maritima]